jgi:hypothetical protein
MIFFEEIMTVFVAMVHQEDKDKARSSFVRWKSFSTVSVYQKPMEHNIIYRIFSLIP